MMPPEPHRNRRQDLLLPLAISALLLGAAALLSVFAAPRIALAVVILSLVVLLAVVRELILIGDR